MARVILKLKESKLIVRLDEQQIIRKFVTSVEFPGWARTLVLAAVIPLWLALGWSAAVQLFCMIQLIGCNHYF